LSRTVIEQGESTSSGLDRLWLLIGIGIAIRLVYLGLLDLLPEEAYYWSYSQHLDYGYLDHPPMVAWLIGLSETVFGRSEFAVRLPAFIGWVVFASVMYRFSVRLCGRSVGKPVVLLLTVLPIYMSVGFLMTPDAPFYVTWAGSLLFLQRALLDGKPLAWIGVGICLGLGLLSKYTMGLIVPTAVVFILLDKKSWHWFRRPQPYFALLIGAVLFLPVVYWNYLHDWMSFTFQGTRRWSGGSTFQLHILVATVLLLITPVGLVSAIRVIGQVWPRSFQFTARRSEDERGKLFMFVFAIVPLSAFVIHSLQGQPKANWTGPVWLSLLPLIGWNMARVQSKATSWWARLNSTAWLPTAVVLLVIYATGFGYLVAGMPGMSPAQGMPMPVAWEEFGERVAQIKAKVEEGTGESPVLVGLDKYWIASQASFYAFGNGYNPGEVAGEKLVGSSSLMWDLWVSPESARGRDCLLIGLSVEQLERLRVTDRFARLGKISKEVLTNFGGEIGYFFWRVGYDYQPD